MIVDAHHHLWHPTRGDYGWMRKGDPVLDRPYGPADLAPHLRAHGIERTVLVQAAPTVAETEYLLGHADATEWVAGVVGWVDFEDAGGRATLDRLSAHPKLVGLRPMIQDIADVGWMLREDLAWAYRALTEAGLAFDALGFPRHLETFHALLTRHPDMRVVIDHCMKPDVAGGTNRGEWERGMTRLARETGAFCKLSGLVTEAAEGWRVDDLRAYADHVLDAFGPERVMWGSDWPVCWLRAEYDVWWDAAQALTAGLDTAGRARVFGGTAVEAYRLDG